MMDSIAEGKVETMSQLDARGGEHRIRVVVYRNAGSELFQWIWAEPIGDITGGAIASGGCGGRTYATAEEARSSAATSYRRHYNG